MDQMALDQLCGISFPEPDFSFEKKTLACFSDIIFIYSNFKRLNFQ